MTDRWASFDCYGTLIDWERGIIDALAGLWPGTDTAALLAKYHETEPQVQRGSGASYRSVLTDVLLRLVERERLPLSDEDRDVLPRSLPQWPPFSEVPGELAELRKRGWRLGILSNTDPDLLDASIRRIGVEVDLRITVTEAGSYKPAHAHWERFFEMSGAPPSHHVHVARSLFHDIAPCAELGLKAVWINRADERTDLELAAELPTLEGLADVLDGVAGV